MFKQLYLKTTLLALLTVASLAAFSQPVASRGFQANVNHKPGSGNGLTIRIRPLANITTGFTTMDFNIRVPASQPFSFLTLFPNLTNFPGMNMIQYGPIQVVSGGVTYNVYEFLSTVAAPGTGSKTYTAGTSYEVFTITMNVDPSTLNIELAHENTQNDWFYALAGPTGNDLMAQDAGGTVVPASFFYPTTTISGSNFLSSITSLLPANLGEFNVQKQGDKAAALDWTTLQEQNVNYFAVERSVSQTAGWTKIGEVKAKGESSTPTKYTFNDLTAFDGVGAKTVFYRIRSVDLDAKEMIFPIRSLRFNAAGKGISIYPNPVKDGFTIQVPVLNPADKKIRMNLINQAGQVLNAREISASQAANYYYDIKTPGVIPGEYMLQILLEGELLDTKKILVQR